VQKGQILDRGNNWALRYWVKNVDGEWKRKYKTICPKSDKYRMESQVLRHPDVAKILGVVPAAKSNDVTLSQFVEESYLPYAESAKRPSTYKGYRNMYLQMVKPHVGDIPFLDFSRAETTQVFLDKLAKTPKQDGEKYTQTTLLHVKAFLSGVIAYAQRYGKFGGLGNPLAGKTVMPEGGADSEDTYAHTLSEVEDMLDILTDVTQRTLVVVAMYTGLRRSEIRGLKWSDLSADPGTGWNLLSVGRTFWERTEGVTKTKSSTATIPLIPEAKAILDEYREVQKKDFPAATYIFESPKRPGSPLDLSSIGNKMIAVRLAAAGLKDQDGNNLWHGLHSFRRGLGNAMKDLGIDIEIRANMLRHGGAVTDKLVTEKHYSKASMLRMQDAMQKVSQAIKTLRKKRHAKREENLASK
jgi:integrase